jgi:hypothetical protein
MSETTTTKDSVRPSATPSKDDIRRWQALPQEEQVQRLRQTLRDAEASGISDRTMNEIKAAAKARLAAPQHG